jgi:Fe-S cluster assembly iron-binding protein IscA
MPDCYYNLGEINMIEISASAQNKIKEILAQNPGKCWRIVVEGTGCGGPYLRLYLDEIDAGEKTTNIDGVDLLISDDVRKYAEGGTINIFVN